MKGRCNSKKLKFKKVFVAKLSEPGQGNIRGGYGDTQGDSWKEQIDYTQCTGCLDSRSDYTCGCVPAGGAYNPM